jgi:hypothetical protein
VSKNVPDELLPALRGRPGDLPNPGSSRWGKVARLATGTAINSTKRQGVLDFVQTGIISSSPTPIAIRMRFSTDGTTFTPNVPALFGGNVIVELIEAVDMKSGAFRETYTITPGNPLPICAVLACGLNISVKLDAEDVSLFVEVVAAPTTQIDCAELVGPINATTVIKPFTDAAVVRLPVVTSMGQIAAEPRRAYLLLTNQSTTRSLFIRLGNGVDATPGAELASIILPPNTFAGYEVLNYTGIVSYLWDGADASGYALATQGLYPP